MIGLDADIGTFQAALQEAPEVLAVVGVNLTVHVGFRVVHDAASILRFQIII